MNTVNLLATVTVTGSTTLTATVNGIATVVSKLSHVTANVGDVVLVAKKGAQWYALGRAAITPAAVDNSGQPDPKPPTTSGTLVVSPVETRSYRNGNWRTDSTLVYQGEYGGGGNHTGAVFYGTTPRSLSGATVTAASVQVRRPANTGSTYAAVGTTMWLMTNSTKPAGAPTLTSSSAGPSIAAGATTTFTIPTAWAQAMVDGTAGGIAFYDADGDPYIKFSGRGEWSAAFTLTISWQRS